MYKKQGDTGKKNRQMIAPPYADPRCGKICRLSSLRRSPFSLQPKFRRPPRIDDQPLLDDPDCLLLARNGLLFTEANNHRQVVAA